MQSIKISISMKSKIIYKNGLFYYQEYVSALKYRENENFIVVLIDLIFNVKYYHTFKRFYFLKNALEYQKKQHFIYEQNKKRDDEFKNFTSFRFS